MFLVKRISRMKDKILYLSKFYEAIITEKACHKVKVSLSFLFQRKSFYKDTFMNLALILFLAWIAKSSKYADDTSVVFP